MEYRNYKELYDALATREDLERLSETSPYDHELLMVIYTQRVVKDATKRFYKVKRHARRLHRQWRNGLSFARLAQEHRFPPVLMALIVLEGEGISRRRFWKMLNNLEEVESKRLRRDLREACEADLIYSPEGTERQYKRGAWGEERLWKWLRAKGIPFRTEAELRSQFDKTPDALLSEPLVYDGRKVLWIESKASFGDPLDVRRHVGRQLRPYVDLFGDGLVVYWFGYVEDVDLRLPDGVSITDGRDFGEDG
ncbi:MAG: C15orf41 family protein [Thermoplasmata archaeon]